MKMLRMSTALRRRLASQNAMAINAKGQEVLHGLTVEESRFVVGCSDGDVLDMSDEERDRYAGLILKHERARMRSACVDRGIAKDEERLG
ncbi:hypothetical protein [Variovorax paradoxus]|uniref:Uncharacterized protein n=1 Tax=Variovorax paradoxus TaxID=34073 RepID=A0A0H2LSJ7_VARPD|nr:hypothetical protein [Variovorax paradoxus]KLN53283.1 hypothetical protein VPARA_55990 [Variovorax paradoxus]